MKSILFVLMAIGLSLQVFFVKAQSIEPVRNNFKCGFYKVNSRRLQDSIFIKALRRQMNSKSNARVSAENIFKLPVVVHVVTSGECEDPGIERYKDNPSDERIRYEINEASQRFRHQQAGARTYTNPNYGIDTEIEIALATVDPNGQFTSGITRIVDPAIQGNTWETLSALLDKYKWDVKKYCNLFIVKNITNASGAYAEGGDFTVYSSNSFWSGLINHEVGHYLGLNHIFFSENAGCPSNVDCLISGDGVCDTPPKYQAGSLDEECGFGLNPPNSCTSDEADLSLNNPYRPVSMGGMGDQPDMLTNYMDYMGNCWDSYTLGQKARMRAVIETRAEMIGFSAEAFSHPVPEYYLRVSNIDLIKDGCTGLHIPVVKIENKGASELNSVTVKIINDNSLFTQLSWTGNIASGMSDEISFPGVTLTENHYVLSIVFENPNGMQADVYQDKLCKQFNYGNYNSSVPLNISFAACKNSEVEAIANDVSLKWSVEAFKKYAVYNCKQCVIGLLNNYTPPYTIQKASFELPLRDFTTYTNPVLNFKMGYIPQADSGPFDTLTISVSAECDNFETLWSVTGLSLATNSPPAYNNYDYYFYPSCTQFKDIVLGLKKYSGKKDVRIKIEANGKFMSPLLIDDIIVDNDLSTSIYDTRGNECNIRFTNPVEDKLMVELAPENTFFRIVNAAGHVMFQSNDSQMNVSQLKPGVYLLLIQSDNQLTVRKFIKL